MSTVPDEHYASKVCTACERNECTPATHEVEVSILPGGVRDNTPLIESTTVGEVAVNLTTRWPHDGPKHTAPCWGPTVFHARRSVETALYTTMVVYDFDNGTPVERALDLFPGHARIVYTTWSHTQTDPRFRVVIPLVEPIPAHAWPRVWRVMRREALGAGITPDEQCKDVSRIYLWPATPGVDGPFEAWADLERPLLRIDWRSLPDVERLRAQRRSWAPRPLVRDPYARGRVQRHRDPYEREQIGIEHGGVVRSGGQGRRVEKVPCPCCGDRSVWWWVEPAHDFRARCHHEKHCGWRGPLSDLTPGVW